MRHTNINISTMIGKDKKAKGPKDYDKGREEENSPDKGADDSESLVIARLDHVVEFE